MDTTYNSIYDRLLIQFNRKVLTGWRCTVVVRCSSRGAARWRQVGVELDCCSLPHRIVDWPSVVLLLLLLVLARRFFGRSGESEDWPRRQKGQVSARRYRAQSQGDGIFRRLLSFQCNLHV